jgi:hypothetical protein
MTKQELICKLNELAKAQNFEDAVIVGCLAIAFGTAAKMANELDEPPTEPCNFCSPDGGLRYLCLDGLSATHNYTPKYCPNCGRKLTEELK